MDSMHRGVLLAAGALLVAGAVMASPRPVGNEVTLQVAEGNGVTAPEVVVAADGTIWSVWEDDVAGIGARAFARDLSAAAPVRSVAANRLPERAPYRGPALVREGVAAVPLADGRLFVVWREQRLDLTVGIFYQRSEVTSSAIAGRLIGPEGRPASPVFTIAERSGEGLGTPSALAVAGRKLVVAWSDRGSEEQPAGSFARLVAPNGRALSQAFALDDAGAGSRPALAPSDDGGFLAVWQRHDDGGVAVRGFGAEGVPAGPAATVTGSPASLPVVARGGDGGYLVAWVGPVPESASGMLEHRVYGRSLDPQGVPVGPVRALSSGGGRAHGSPAVIAAGEDYLAAWTVWGRNRPRSVRAARLDALGRAPTESVRLSARAINFQWSLGLGAAPSGRYVATWVGYDDEDRGAINGRVLETASKMRVSCGSFASAGSSLCGH